MKRLIKLFSILVLFVITLSPVYSIEPSGATKSPETKTNLIRLREENRVKRQEDLENFKLIREENRLRLEEARNDAKQNFEQRKEEFRNRLSQIKDERKRMLVSNIADRLEVKNDRWLNHWALVLDRLDQLVIKIESRADTLEEEGQDVASVRQATLAADEKINTARSAIELQLVNNYVIEISDEDQLKADVGEVTSKFRADLQIVKDAVIQARSATHEAVIILKSLENNN